MKDKLTPKQRKYCRERAKGKNQREAFEAAGYGPGSSRKTKTEEACRMEKLPKIQAELARLTALAEAGAVLDRQQRIAILSEMALDEDRKDDSRQRALDMLNKMGGDYTDRQIIEAHADVQLSYEEKRQAVLDALMDDQK